MAMPRLCLCLLILTVGANTAGAFRRHANSRASQTSLQPNQKQGWGLALLLRGGSDDKRKPEGASEEEEEEDSADDDEEDWVDTREEETDEYDTEEEEEAVTDEVTLSEVLLAQQEEEEAADIINLEDDDFVDALQEGIDIDMVAASSINTDDDSSSANVDRMDLADAYDEELTADDEQEPLSPVLATGEDDDDDNTHLAGSNDLSANIAPGGGTDDENSASSNAPTEGVAKVITDEMKQALGELKWKKREIRHMRPDMAAVVIAKKVPRPREGMPASMSTSGVKPTTSGPQWSRALKRVVLPICVGAVAVYAGTEVDWEDLLDGRFSPTPSDDPPQVEAEPTAPPVYEEEFAEEEAADATLDEQDEQQEESERASDDKSPHVHSIKPYSPPDDVELDQTWLDVIITKVENFIKGILTKEL